MTDNDRWRRRVAMVWVLGAVVAAWMELRLLFSHSVSDGTVFALLMLFVGALVLSVATVHVLGPSASIEAIVPGRRTLYRGALAITIAAALFGFAWSVDGVTGRQGVPVPARIYAAFFIAIAILAYRALAATSPRHAVLLIVVVLLTWLPAMIVGAAALDDSPYVEVTWSGAWSAIALSGVLYGICLVAAATLVAFRRVDVVVPEARLR